MLNFSRKLVGSWVFSILFVVKIKLNTSRLSQFALLISSMESLGVPICRGNRTWLPKYGNLQLCSGICINLENTWWKQRTQEERTRLTKKLELCWRHLHEPHEKSVNGSYWWGYDISQKTWHCSTCRWSFHAYSNPPASKPMMLYLSHSKNKGALTMRLNILAFLSSTVGSQTRVGNCCFFNDIVFNLLNTYHLLTFFFFLTFGKTHPGRKASFFSTEKKSSTSCPVELILPVNS